MSSLSRKTVTRILTRALSFLGLIYDWCDELHPNESTMATGRLAAVLIDRACNEKLFVKSRGSLESFELVLIYTGLVSCCYNYDEIWLR